MAIVTRKFMCKKCEETSKVTYSQEDVMENNFPQNDGEFLPFFGMCRDCYFGDKIE